MPAALDQTAWQAWLEKGRLQDEKRTRIGLETVNIVSAAGLLAAAAFWPDVAQYEVVFRFAATLAAGFVMFHAMRSGHYVLGTLFAAMALFYNPAAQLFTASDELKRVMFMIGAMAFILALGRDMRNNHE